ncbi:pilus assembly protein Flp/PilA [Eubacterium uniforme]|uniref:Pilus assembly protein Flp/PilA n=2 Tax=Eubacterium TaxID=1730 RepID=A0A1T4VMM8_9FIRM|nr:Flp family type IVb pilin [Eubacterium uniforme]SKA66145.1 pilus assembly protein Flp/PilA [Eubacterium uniforme]
MRKMLDFLKDENGQGMVEYGLIIALIAIVVIAALTILGPKIA